MTRRKPLSVVEAGRKGGSVRSPAKTAAVRANAAQPRGKRREQWYADGWRDAMERALSVLTERINYWRGMAVKQAANPNISDPGETAVRCRCRADGIADTCAILSIAVVPAPKKDSDQK